MKRKQCSGRNAKGTGPCQATASAGFDTCARCGGRRKPRAARTAGEHDGRELVAAFDAAPDGVEALAASVLDEESTASAVSPEANRPVAEGPVEAVDTDHAEAACGDCLDPMCTGAPCKHTSAPIVEASADLVLDARGVRLYRAEWTALAEVARMAGGVDALIVDAPYSERTHAGHDGADRNDGSGVIVARHDPSYGHREKARGINYQAWSDCDVRAFVSTWSPLTRGWFVSITDHVLAPTWRAALEEAGRYAFAPLPLVCIGSTVRLVGDGPCSWTCWVVVSRPANGEWLAAWRAERRARGQKCALPGAYHYTGHGDRVVMGGKTTESIRALVRDYSAPGDTIADPTCGGGTLGVACIAEGRRALLGDRDAAHVEIARKRLLSCPGEQRRLTLDVDAPRMTQASLLETGS